MFGHCEESCLATESEACAEYALNAGHDNPEREWILTPFDTWQRNPFYTGPRGRHPEDDYDNDKVSWLDSDDLTDVEIAALECNDLPF